MKSIFHQLNRLFTRPQSRRRAATASRPTEALEDRTLLSNLNLTAAGNLVFSGGAEANNLNVSFNGTHYRFEDSSGTAINLQGGVVGLDINPAVNIVEFDPALAVGAFNQIIISPGGGDDTTSILSMRPGQEGLTVNNVAGDGTDVLNVANGIGTLAQPVLGNLILRGDTVNLGGSFFITNLADVSVQGTTNLLTDVVINAAGFDQAVTFSNTVDGPGGLTILSSNTDLRASVGAGTPLAHLDLQGVIVRLRDANVAGDMNIKTDNLVLTPPLTTWTGVGEFGIAPFTPNQDMFIPQNQIAVAGFSSLAFGDALTRSVTITQNITIPIPATFTAATVNLNGIYTGNPAATIRFVTNTLNIAPPNRIVGGGPIEIAALASELPLVVNASLGTVGWGQSNATVAAGTAGVVFNGTIGGNTNNLDIDSDGDITFAANSGVVISGDADITAAGTITLPAGVQAPNGGISIEGQLVLSGSSTFRVGAGRDLLITGDIDAGGNSIIIRSANGAANSIGIDGNVTNADGFQIDSSGGNASLTTSLRNVQANNVIVRGQTVLLGGDITSTSNIDIQNPVVLTADIALTSGGAATNQILLSTIDGAGFSLALNGGLGKLLLPGQVGGLNPIHNLTITSGGSQFINQNITLTGALNWNNNGLLVNKAVITAPGGATLVGTPFINNGTII